MGPSRRVVLLVVAAALATLSALRRPAERPRAAAGASASPRPGGWANERLTVFDGTGSPLFEHRFGFALQAGTSSETVALEVGPAPVVIADVDGDGRNEVLVRPNAVERAERKLYCFEADGRVRFVHQPTGTRRFGDDEYAEPWLAHRVFVTRGPAARGASGPSSPTTCSFPAVLRELDPRDGAVRQEYWSNGFIETVQEEHLGRAARRPRRRHQQRLPRGEPGGLPTRTRVAGSTPAVRPGYACRDCAPGGPEALFIFPSLCLARERGQAGVHEAWVEQGERVRVQRGAAGRRGRRYYVLGPRGTLLAAEISREFQAAHARLERQGVLDHPFGPRDDADMFPVRRWDGTRFVELPRVKVAH